MKTIAYILVSFSIISFLKWFNVRYKLGIYYINKLEEEQESESSRHPISIANLKPENYDHAMDLRGAPTHLCPCGCNVWNLKVIFEDFEIGTYFLDMECASCGSVATAPTLLDKGIKE